MHRDLDVSLDLTIFFILIFSFLLARFIWRDPERRAAMKKFLDKAKAAFGDDAPPPGQQQQAPIQGSPAAMEEPTETDVLRYRYQHGTNLGSIFIMERWLTGSMYHESAQGSSELAAVEARVKHEGIEKARDRHERHWREYVSDADLDWLRDAARCNAVRLPLGYFTLGPPYCEGTPFQHVAPVYQNAWPAVKELVRRCHERGIGVLVDLHGLPGGANAQDHSGTNSGKAEFWSSRASRDLATRCLCFIAQQARGMPGVIGLQIVNEAEWNAKGMYEWYDSVLAELARIDPTLPVYVSDAWDLNKAVAWTQSRNAARSSAANPVVIDTHLYWCFSDADKHKSPQQITDEAKSKLHALDGKDGSVFDRGAAQAVVGEYSCVLSEDTWSKGQGTPKDQLVRNFGQAESQRFQSRAGGSFFWTYRMDWMPGGEWGFKRMTEQRAITPPASLTFSPDEIRNRADTANSQRDQRKQSTVSSHCNYWDTHHRGTYEHWRFEQGWDRGFADALAFWEMRSLRGLAGAGGADKIGMVDLWCLKRVRESGNGGSKFGWEFEQGFRQGVRDFYQSVGV